MNPHEFAPTCSDPVRACCRRLPSWKEVPLTPVQHRLAIDRDHQRVACRNERSFASIVLRKELRPREDLLTPGSNGGAFRDKAPNNTRPQPVHGEMGCTCASEWCPWPESNQHSLRNSILSRARLPVPPQGPFGHKPKGPVARSRRNIAAGPFRSTRVDVILPRLDRKSPARYHGIQA
jgi:hypothetical protein